ncbi:MAG: hypothetical protein ACRYFX_19000 [Janthinobacterium lividum]
MKKLLFCLLAGWVFGLMFFRCSSSRPPTTTEPPAAPLSIGGIIERDSTGKLVDSVVAQPPPRLEQKTPFLARIFSKNTDSKPQAHVLAGAASASRKCKNCAYYTVAGPATITTAAKKATILGDGAVLAEKKATAAKADSGAVLDVATTGKGPAAAGPGATATEVKPGFPWGKVLGGAAGILAVGAALYFGWPLLLAAFRRKKDEQA